MSEFPIFREIIPSPSVEETLALFSERDHLVLLESVRRHDLHGRYSFLAADPIQTSLLDTPEYGVDPFRDVKKWSEQFKATPHPDLPPFQGGFAGLLSYDLGRCWERLPVPFREEFDLPACVVGMYDWVIAWDHQQDRCWVIAHGFPETSLQARKAKGVATCEELSEQILSQPRNQCDEQLSPQSVELDFNIESNFTREEYLDVIQRVIDYIVAGDIFQANLSQQLMTHTHHSALEIYNSLRQHNPAPFAGLFQQADWAVLSSSPERFIQKHDRFVRTRPIKGTRQRRVIPEADLFTRDELRESEKDQAENVMIVDLLRNDLSRVCKPGTIRVPELCTIESYETVTHLVSEVIGELKDDVSFWDVIAATFPGGSITGAPKIRAMEIISELEQVARGPYCGSLFYCGFDGTADSSILIRTLTKQGSKLVFPVGGGIVSQSNPQSEFEETDHKAAGMRSALKSIMK